jgi:hypothetical protein
MSEMYRKYYDNVKSDYMRWMTDLFSAHCAENPCLLRRLRLTDPGCEGAEDHMEARELSLDDVLRERQYSNAFWANTSLKCRATTSI